MAYAASPINGDAQRWGTMPMVCYTFLESYDFTEKTIIPFCTNEGSGMGSSVRFIKKLCPGANVEDGTPIHGAEAANADREAREIANRSLTPDPSPKGEGSR